MTWRIYQHPSDAEASGNSNDNESVPEETTESVAAPADPMAQLQADLKAAKDEVAEWQDRFLRKAAEFENFRKRTDREKADSMMLAKSSVLIEFLPVADACERALDSFAETRETSPTLNQYKEGVELLYKQLLDTLKRVGVVPIESEGKPFDPHLHEALSREESSEVKEDTVAKELRRGYLFKDRLLRPAQVIVAVHSRKDQTS
ncbi:MAG: nucleotide exchange factor GrpE [Acidobacteria bacterium]|nr:nucleotide exchange factor GrpE [Acidobacteriota bacterium]